MMEVAEAGRAGRLEVRGNEKGGETIHLQDFSEETKNLGKGRGKMAKKG